MKNILYLLFLLLSGCNAQTGKEDAQPVTQQPPFFNDIQHFKKQDSISFPPKDAILLIGSSSFTMWKDVKDYFPGYTIVNRGFGGSTLSDQIRYADEIIFPYQPKQIVIYCGENDLASSDTVTAAMVVDRFKQLYQIIRAKTTAPVAFIALKPSPSRRHLFAKMREANREISVFLSSQPQTAFIDVRTKMLNTAGEPIPEIFLEDSLHMNAKGYAIWQENIKPVLIK